jgi:hypothetical protein
MARRRSRRPRPLGALLDNVQPWQIAVGVAAVGGAIWFLTRKKPQEAVNVTVAVPQEAEAPATDLVVTGSSAPPAQTGVTPMQTASDFVGPPAPPPASPSAPQVRPTMPFRKPVRRAGPATGLQSQRRPASSGVAAYAKAKMAKAERAKSGAPNTDPCVGLTGRDALDCRAASAQVDLDFNTSKVRF